MALSKKLPDQNKPEPTQNPTSQPVGDAIDLANMTTLGFDKKPKILVACLVALGLVSSGISFYAGHSIGENKQRAVIATSKDEMRKAVEALGTITSTEENNNLTAYVVDTTNGPQVVYGTSDGKTLILGDVYEAKSGTPLFTDLIKKTFSLDNQAGSTPSTVQQSQVDEAASAPGQLLGEYKGDLPEVFDYLEKLGGYKEDPKVGPESTLYLVYDPRCPYCHEMYEKTRSIDLKGKGVTIKWLPTVALGNEGLDADSTKRAVAGLYIKNATELGATFGPLGEAPMVSKVSEKDMDKLHENLSMLIEVTDQVYGPNAGAAVPTGFYLDKKTGKPRAVRSAQTDEALKAVFGDI